MPDQLERFTDIDQKLNFLRQGKPIDGNTYGLIRNTAVDAQAKFCKSVVDITKSGPQGRNESTWLIGFYGGGKTQALNQFVASLGGSTFGEFKVLVCRIQLDHAPSKTPTGFHSAIFQSASAFSLGAVATNVLQQRQLSGSTVENVVLIGVDVVSTALSFHAPGSGVLAKIGLGWAKRWWDLRHGHLEKLVKTLKFKDIRATELMVKWMQYSLAPAENSRRNLNDYVQLLADERSLFAMLSHILRTARYATVIIMIDQAEELAGNPELTNELMNIYNRERADVDLNIFYVFAGTDEVDVISPEIHGGFYRRFRDARQCTTINAGLGMPIIDGSPNNDVDRIWQVLAGLKQEYPGLPIPELNNQRLGQIKINLAANGPVTWPVLWKLMLE